MSSHPSKLAELAAPTRGRVKYAPLTAGLLARKGEAMPATPYFAAEALDLYAAGPIVVARHEPVSNPPHRDVYMIDRAGEPSTAPRRPAALSADEAHRALMPSRAPQPWRIRRPVLPHEERAEAQRTEKFEPKVADADPDHANPAGEQAAPLPPQSALRIAVSLDIDLDLVARLALHARHAGRPPARIVEEALKSHLAVAGDTCPTCARALGEMASQT